MGVIVIHLETLRRTGDMPGSAGNKSVSTGSKSGSAGNKSGSAGNKPGSTWNHCKAVLEKQHLLWERC